MSTLTGYWLTPQRYVINFTLIATPGILRTDAPTKLRRWLNVKASHHGTESNVVNNLNNLLSVVNNFQGFQKNLQ